MIDLHVSGLCKDCPGMDLAVGTFYADGTTPVSVVRCKNERLCQYLQKHLTAAMGFREKETEVGLNG